MPSHIRARGVPTGVNYMGAIRPGPGSWGGIMAVSRLVTISMAEIGRSSASVPPFANPATWAYGARDADLILWISGEEK